MAQVKGIQRTGQPVPAVFPDVVDPAQIKAALVEMVLREKQTETKDKPNPGMSPFYIEISPAGGCIHLTED